ncbi:hypothetical protein D4764_01G0014090 [Takifugu flavidus]|uniref:Uncharacterized protein n=1 Tax=Takifugu flavidus TaxID=433684 RepID=A0A5C6PPK6_9TELE|nr:hypothetical protein D4764_01G0014090 [Takifugu flavidus]
MLSVPAEASDNGCYPWARDVGLIWIGSPIGIPLEGMEHVPCESNAECGSTPEYMHTAGATMATGPVSTDEPKFALPMVLCVWVISL